MTHPTDPKPFKLACIQNTATTDMAANVTAVTDLVRKAHAAGARFVATPENVTLLQRNFQIARAQAKPLAEHTGLQAFRALAAELGIWFLAGSVAALRPDGRLANTSVLIDDKGGIVATYEKIHMFDVDLPDGKRFRESETYRPGDEAVLAPTPWGPLGMTVCYDLRFPGLYRDLARAGAVMLSVPSAFTRTTGEAHWHILLRARAIETGTYVLAPAQYGEHDGGYRSYGHALIVDPWGRVLADGGEGQGFVLATIDPAQVAATRAQIPSLDHGRPYAVRSLLPAGRAAAE